MEHPSLLVLHLKTYGAFSFALLFVRLLKVFSLLPPGKGQKMKTNRTFLVRADVTRPFDPDNWYIFTPDQFRKFKETAEFRKCARYFTVIDACEGGGDTIIAECERDKALKYGRERARERYLRKLEKELGITFISFEELISTTDNDRNGRCGDDLFIDPSSDVEKMILEKERNEEIQRAVDRLSPVRRSIIRNIYLDDDLTISECARILAIDRSYAYYHKKASFKTLRRALFDRRYDHE